jgi:hypothetical protein
MVVCWVNNRRSLTCRDVLNVSLDRLSDIDRRLTNTGFLPPLARWHGYQNLLLPTANNSCLISLVRMQAFNIYCKIHLRSLGWMTLIGWQFGNASGVFLTGSLVQSMITIYGGRAIATIQNLSMSVHILALIAIVGKCCCIVCS